MSFLPKIFRCSAPQLLHGGLDSTAGTINCGSWFSLSCSSLGQSVSRFSAAVFVCRRHLYLLPSSSHRLIKRNLPRHIVYQQLCVRTKHSHIYNNGATKALILSRSGLPTPIQRWLSVGSSGHSNDLPTIVKIVRPNYYYPSPVFKFSMLKNWE